MKKKQIIALSFATLFFPVAVMAQGAQNGRMVQDQDRVNYPDAEAESTMAPDDSQVRNQVQNQFQNVGGEAGFMAATQQMEQLMNMENADEEVGMQIRTVAQEQVQAQAQIQTQINKLDNRSGLMRQLFGTDLTAVRNLKMEMEQNQLRIMQLEEIAAKVKNMGEVTQLTEAVQAMVAETTALQNRIQAEEKVQGMFGWLVRMFQK